MADWNAVFCGADFQAYAEGIFLPLARQLQQNTLVLASSLSAKARDLRLSHQALDASLAGQRVLEEKLHVVYAVNFHSFVYLRPLREGETTGFRGPAPRQLTLALNDGFENRSNILETYEFEKVNPPLAPLSTLNPLTRVEKRVTLARRRASREGKESEW